MNSVVVEGLEIKLGSRRILRINNLALPMSGISILVGPNGAGKSTFLNCLTGLTKPTSGSVMLFDEFEPDSPDARIRVASVAQNIPIFQDHTAKSILEMCSLWNTQFNMDLAMGILTDQGIPLHVKASSLSGGLQAQLALGISIAKQPDLLILDEPLSSLDPLARIKFMRMLVTCVAEREMSVILTSHDINDVARYADYLLLFMEGEIQLFGEVDKVLEQHRVIIADKSDFRRLMHDYEVLQYSFAGSQMEALAKIPKGKGMDPKETWQIPSLEEIVVGYLSGTGETRNGQELEGQYV